MPHRDSNVKEPMITAGFPDRPYQILSTDLFYFDNRDYYSLTIDHYSRFYDIDYLPDTSSGTAIVRKLQTHFARYGVCDNGVCDNGVCDILHSNNGQQFSSSVFADFAKSLTFQHKISLPLHLQGNCLVESSVGIANKLFEIGKGQ